MINEPDLWTLKGIEAALPGEEWGAAFEWGAVLVGTFALDRHADPSEHLRPALDHEVWANVCVDECEVKELLRHDAARHLSPGTRFELRKKYPSNYGRSFGMAWYRSTNMDEAPDWGLVLETPKRRDGYLLVGEHVTPAPIVDLSKCQAESA